MRADANRLRRRRPERLPAADPAPRRSRGDGRSPAAQANASAAWRALDLAILHELVLRRGLGITDEQVRAGEHVSYTRAADAALASVRERADGTRLAVLVNATPPAAIRDVALAGDRMPQKSTYFYPEADHRAGHQPALVSRISRRGDTASQTLRPPFPLLWYTAKQHDCSGHSAARVPDSGAGWG